VIDGSIPSGTTGGGSNGNGSLDGGRSPDANRVRDPDGSASSSTGGSEGGASHTGGDASPGKPDASAPASCDWTGSRCKGSRWVDCEGGIEKSATDCTVTNKECVEGYCDPGKGCETRNRPVGSPCDDEKFCTVADSCLNGICAGRTGNCADSSCVQQHCDETLDKCVVDQLFDDMGCGTGLACKSGACTTTENCTGACKPDCAGESTTCDFACRDSMSCDVACTDRQICKVDCENSTDCKVSCDAVYADCNVACAGANSCETHCAAGDCNTACEGAKSCKTTCTGAYSVCPIDCDGTIDCGVKCDDGAHCNGQCDKAGKCDNFCAGESQCELSCQDSAQCTTTCGGDSRCDLSCQGSTYCRLVCTGGAECTLRCDEGASSETCRITECSTDPIDCGDGVFVCNTTCP